MTFHDGYDIWCRDFMPIQVEKDLFVQFSYAPRYLVQADYLYPHGLREQLQEICHSYSAPSKPEDNVRGLYAKWFVGLALKIAQQPPENRALPAQYPPARRHSRGPSRE